MKAKLAGVLTLLNLLQLVFEGDNDPIRFRQVITSVDKICQVINGEYQHVLDSDSPSQMMVMVGSMSAEGFTKRLASVRSTSIDRG